MTDISVSVFGSQCLTLWIHSVWGSVLDSGEHFWLEMFYTIKQMQSADMFVRKFWGTGRSDSVLTTVGFCNVNWNEQHVARSGLQVLDILCTSISFDSFSLRFDCDNDFNVYGTIFFFFVFVKQYRTKKIITRLLVFFLFSVESVTTWKLDHKKQVKHVIKLWYSAYIYRPSH